MPFKRGDHVCCLYSTRDELAREVCAFLTDGLRRRDRCWYVGAGDEMGLVQDALLESGIDVDAAIGRHALRLISGAEAYTVRGHFDPEATIEIFNDAIEQAYTDGFSGFRAAADMSWALDFEDGPKEVIVYEALLKSLFAGCRAIGLCLYDRGRMPLTVINGALATHPIAGSEGQYRANPFFDPATARLTPVDPTEVREKLARLERSRGRSAPGA